MLKLWVILSKSRRYVIMLNTCFILSTQCLMMLKGYVIVLNTHVVLSMQCLIVLKDYVILLDA